jgi:CRP/FNR family cyclic AMP-dependent transcriptional regulator
VLFGTSHGATIGHDYGMASRNLPSFTRPALLDLRTIPMVDYGRAEVIFSPGDACDSVMYIQRGGVTLSAVAKSGREAVVALLGPGDFFGEGCLAGQRTRVRSATAITSSTILVIARDQMIRLLRRRPVWDRFLSHVLVRHITIEQDLIDQLFNSVNKRPARG